jgi:hypothetical protein
MSPFGFQEEAKRALEHVRHLSVKIGGRGSCTPSERQAAQYTVDQMEEMGVQNARLESFKGAPSTYRPFALAFGVALLGTLATWLGDGREWLVLAALLNGLGAIGMLAESDLSPNWTRRLLPRATSHNAFGVIPAAIQARQRAVLCAHVDTHRTPVFFSTPTWRKFFNRLLSLAFLSMPAAAAFFALGALLGLTWVRGIGLLITLMQASVVGLIIHADFTPFTPGANDNASGVGVVLEIGQRLAQDPLPFTEVWLVFTGCEETGAVGMAAFLDTHAKELGGEAIFVILDEAGLGKLQYITADGLVIKHPTHPKALELVRRAAASLPGISVSAHIGLAYTDALVATKRNLIALTLGCLPEDQSGETSHWHQISDTLEHVDLRALEDSLAITWQVLKEVDKL